MRFCTLISLLLIFIWTSSISNNCLIAQNNKDTEKKKKYDFTIKYKAGFEYIKDKSSSVNKKLVFNGKLLKNQKSETHRKDKITVISQNNNDYPKEIKVEVLAHESKEANLKGHWFKGKFDNKKKLSVTEYSKNFPESRKESAKNYSLSIMGLPEVKLAVGEEKKLDKKLIQKWFEDEFKGTGKTKLEKIEKKDKNEIAHLNITLNLESCNESTGGMPIKMKLAGKVLFNITKQIPISVNLSGTVSGSANTDNGAISLEGTVKIKITFSSKKSE